MIKKSDLPLVEAMNSIELFHAKMDTGMIADLSTSGQKISSPKEEEQSRLFDRTRQYKPEEFLWIMDEMLAAEVSLPLLARN